MSCQYFDVVEQGQEYKLMVFPMLIMVVLALATYSYQSNLYIYMYIYKRKGIIKI